VEDKIKTTYVTKDSSAASGIAMIAVATGGENMIVVASGANMQVTIEDVNKAREMMREADLLLVQLEVPLEVISTAVELAKAYNVPVVMNPAPAQALSPSLLACVDVITPNELELKTLSGSDDLLKGARTLLDWGVQHVVVTLGANGVRVVDETIDQHVPAHEVTAVDTTAAGDAFNGALAVALAEGKTLMEAVRYGTAAGALATTKRGAQPSLPTREAVEQFLASNNANRG
jgi:ribokinase